MSARSPKALWMSGAIMLVFGLVLGVATLAGHGSTIAWAVVVVLVALGARGVVRGSRRQSS